MAVEAELTTTSSSATPKLSSFPSDEYSGRHKPSASATLRVVAWTD
jgi:hypothetical protein